MDNSYGQKMNSLQPSRSCIDLKNKSSPSSITRSMSAKELV